MLLWESVKDEFAWEGSWRDVCVPDASVATWEAAVEALRAAELESHFEFREARSPFPTDVAEVLAHSSEVAALWSISTSGVRLCCHFFDSTEIEFDLDPRDVVGQSQLDALLTFTQLLAGAAGKTVSMTPENMHDAPFIRVHPSGTAEYISSGGFFREIADAHAAREGA